MERTLFMLGSHPSLSLAELMALAARFEQPWQPTNIDPGFAILRLTVEQAKPLFEASGGLVRLAAVIAEGGQKSDPIPVMVSHLAKRRGRIIFGVSGIGKGGLKAEDVRKLGLAVKDALTEQGRAVRFVFGSDPVLSAASVVRNHLIGRGSELIYARQGDAWWLAETVMIQPFEDFAQRDVGRPNRDLKAGTMPPKLARLLINLTRTPISGTLLDPFLGSGTVAQEAALLGYRNVIGSDIEASAVERAMQNLSWLERKQGISRIARTVVSPVEQLPGKLPARSIDGIATEPYLGPALLHDVNQTRRYHLIKDLGLRYLAAFQSLAQLLRPGARVAIVFPVFSRRDPDGFLPIMDQVMMLGFRVIPPLPPELMSRFQGELSFRNSLLYHREKQHVWREVMLLEKR